jgi:glucosamine--fructose-6-phosphate aminotransferase (isomerizing)
MCGIFGYVGKRTDATQIVFEGLKTLEYRGYDSWGIAARIKTPNESIHEHFIVEKQTGKTNQEQFNKTLASTRAQLSLGHTRWATHGGVTVANAHPHLDCHNQIAVVHNGIIENFLELKQELIEQGHIFLSETDTEIVPHLIEEYLKKKEGLPAGRHGFATAVRHAFNRLHGMNAIVAAYAPSKEIIAAKTGSPLAVGVGVNNEEFFVASDATGISKHTQKILFVADNQMVILGDTLQLLELPTGKAITPEIHKITWTFEDSNKGNYPHFILKEIHEQPKVLENIARTYSDKAQQLANLIDKAFGTFMLGCGTASYAGTAGTYLFSSIAKRHINFTIGSEFSYLEDYIQKGTLIIPISQSGETIDVVDPVAKAKQKGATIAALVNVIGSTLYRQADHKFILRAGQEKAVVATKSFMSMFAILFLTAYTLANKATEATQHLLNAASDIKTILQDENQKALKDLAEEMKNQEHIYILGRGLSYATALEAALKIKETSCVHAEGFAGGELKHGVIALIDKNTPCIIFAPNDETYDEIISNAQEVKARGGFIIGIGFKNNAVFDRFFQTADSKEATLLSEAAYAQLIAYYLALARGITDPDKPRNLAKSVTVK